MNILIVPDSFKGSLSSKEVCKSIKSGIESVENHNITCLPFADGGEGFGECLSGFCNGEILYTRCSDIYGKSMKGHIYTYENYCHNRKCNRKRTPKEKRRYECNNLMVRVS